MPDPNQCAATGSDRRKEEVMNQQKLTILYERLSRDDGEDGVSNSILNQRQLLEEYANRNGLVPFRHIQDDGYSGTNWKRPGWQEVLAMVEADEVSCICVKDISRMSRDYLRAVYDVCRSAAIPVLIDEIQAMLDDVSWQRAGLGAYSNRLDFTSRSLDISSENLSDAESRVRNTDMAREMMRFTMSNVLQQAAVSMLAQANQLPNNLLQLLR